MARTYRHVWRAFAAGGRVGLTRRDVRLADEVIGHVQENDDREARGIVEELEVEEATRDVEAALGAPDGVVRVTRLACDWEPDHSERRTPARRRSPDERLEERLELEPIAQAELVDGSQGDLTIDSGESRRRRRWRDGRRSRGRFRDSRESCAWRGGGCGCVGDVSTSGATTLLVARVVACECEPIRARPPRNERTHRTSPAALVQRPVRIVATSAQETAPIDDFDGRGRLAHSWVPLA